MYEPGAPSLPSYVLRENAARGVPVLGICYGMQLLAYNLGGTVAGSTHREYGQAEVELDATAITPHDSRSVWMSHGDRIEQVPPGFHITARSANSPMAGMADESRKIFALQFHPEVNHTQNGRQILSKFVHEVCGLDDNWTAANIIEDSVAKIREQVGTRPVICGLSGGVDSSVAAALVHRAIGDQLTCVFVDTGLLRKDEGAQVIETFQREQGMRLIAVNAAEDFMDVLGGITDPEEKRKRIGEKFVRIFEAQVAQVLERVQVDQVSNVTDLNNLTNVQSPKPVLLAQGTLYPDVIESRGPERQSAAKIKTHHNVGGLPKDMQFDLLEPLRFLFKDEVRTVGSALGLPDSLVWRQPFPGPGLAVRCLGEITWERVERLRAADAIVQEELRKAGLMGTGSNAATSQAFCGVAAGAHGWRDGRWPHLHRSHCHSRCDHRRLHDRRLGAHPVRGAGAHE